MGQGTTTLGCVPNLIFPKQRSPVSHYAKQRQHEWKGKAMVQRDGQANMMLRFSPADVNAGKKHVQAYILMHMNTHSIEHKLKYI